MSYRNGMWNVRDGDVRMVFPHYPYLAFYDIEGYLRNGEWSLERGATVIDAGGCAGEFAVYASKCVGPTGRVLMLEPDPVNVERSRRILAMNGDPANVKIIAAGLWNTKGVLRFSAGQSEKSSLVESAAVDSADMIEIPTVTLKGLVEAEQLDRLDFVKMDIEGAELEAIEAVGDLPARMKPRFAIASYHPRDGEATAGRLERMLRGAGYTVTTGNLRHMTTWASVS